MPIDISLRVTGTEASIQGVLHQRDHPRFPVEAEVALARAGASAGIVVRGKDLSWGGASVVVPRRPLDLDDSVVLRFPWHKGGTFSARGEVVWNQQIDDQHFLGGVSFSKLAVRDEEKLQRLLSMLMRTERGIEQETSLAETLEIRFLDRREMLATLEQIRFGAVETTAFKSFQANERIRLDLAGFSDLPTLHLRARILWQKAFSLAGNPQASGLFRVALALEHPVDDLKRVTDPLIKRLNADNTDGSSALLDR